MSSNDQNPSSPLADLAQQLASAIDAAVPEAAKSQLQPLVQQALNRFDLVPRSELDGHLALLASLEARVAELESALAAATGRNAPDGQTS